MDYDLNTLLLTRGLRARYNGIQGALDPQSLNKHQKSKVHRVSMQVDSEDLGASPSSIGLLNAPSEILDKLAGNIGRDGDRGDGDMYGGYTGFPGQNDGPNGGENTSTQASRPSGKAAFKAISRSAVTMRQKFRTRRAHDGIWMFPDRSIAPEEVYMTLRGVGTHLTRNLTNENFEAIYDELRKHDAIYYAGDVLNRFVVRMTIRLHFSDLPAISYMGATGKIKWPSEDDSTDDRRISFASSDGAYSGRSPLEKQSLTPKQAVSPGPGRRKSTTFEPGTLGALSDDKTPPPGSARDKKAARSSKSSKERRKSTKDSPRGRSKSAAEDSKSSPERPSEKVEMGQLVLDMMSSGETKEMGEEGLQGSARAHWKVLQENVTPRGGLGLGLSPAKGLGHVLEVCCAYTNSAEDEKVYSNMYLWEYSPVGQICVEAYLRIYERAYGMSE